MNSATGGPLVACQMGMVTATMKHKFAVP
jgi:hypothetical protein